MASATVLARDKRLAIEERERVEAEKAERRRRAEQRHENAKALKKHINELIDTHRKISKLAAMADSVSDHPGAESWASKRFVEEVLGYRAHLLQNYQTEHFEYVFNALEVAEGDDLLIEA